MAGIDIVHVPYKGTGPNLIDLVAGRTQATSAGTPPLMPHVKAGKLRVIAVGGAKRLPIAARGRRRWRSRAIPGFETTQWYGLNAPAKTPAAIIKRLADEAAKAAKQPSVPSASRWTTRRRVGSTPRGVRRPSSPSEQTRWGDVVRKANIKAN